MAAHAECDRGACVSGSSWFWLGLLPLRTTGGRRLLVHKVSASATGDRALSSVSQPCRPKRTDARARCFVCGITFELSGRQRQDARPGHRKMYTVPCGRAWWPAVGAPLERGVMPHPRATSVVGYFCRPGRYATPSRLTAEQGRYSAVAASATAQRLDARGAMNCSDVGPVA